MQDTLKPYLINAFYSWCMDIGYNPLVTIHQWSKNVLPSHLSNDKLVIFNIHPNAIRNLIFKKDTIEFEAMFGGNPFQVVLYYKSIASIYNKEDSYGLNFDIGTEESEPKPNPKKPKLTLIKNED